LWVPDSGIDLCSQPTISRWKNAPTRQEVAAMSYAMIDILLCASIEPLTRARRLHRRSGAALPTNETEPEPLHLAPGE
jgi:hypothetical protein